MIQFIRSTMTRLELRDLIAKSKRRQTK